MLEHDDASKLAYGWWAQAVRNHAKWGDEGPFALIAVMTEELGEVARAVIDLHYDSQVGKAYGADTTAPAADFDKIRHEVSDLAAVCFQLIACVDAIEHGERTPTRIEGIGGINIEGSKL